MPSASPPAVSASGCRSRSGSSLSSLTSGVGAASSQRAAALRKLNESLPGANTSHSRGPEPRDTCYSWQLCPHGVEMHRFGPMPACCRLAHHAPVRPGPPRPDSEAKLDNMEATIGTLSPTSPAGTQASAASMCTHSASGSVLTSPSLPGTSGCPVDLPPAPDDYLGIGLSKHPLSDPFLVGNLYVSWMRAILFMILRYPMYVLSFGWGLFEGALMCIAWLWYWVQGRAHDQWDMSDALMAQVILGNHQDRCTRLKETPHRESHCVCGRPSGVCHYFEFDARNMTTYIPFRALYVASTVTTLIAHADPEHSTSIHSIWINGQEMFASSASTDAWKLAKLYVRQSLFYMQSVGSHPLKHFSCEAFEMVTSHFFSPEHIITQLCYPHWEHNRIINDYVLLGAGSILNPGEGTSVLFGVHTAGRISIMKLIRCVFKERIETQFSPMHVFPTRERIHGQEQSKPTIVLVGKRPPPWHLQDEAEAEADKAAEADRHGQEKKRRDHDAAEDDAAPSMSTLPVSSPRIHNWLTLNPAFYPYYKAIFLFVSRTLHCHSSRVQIGSQRVVCEEYLRALQHYLRTNVQVVAVDEEDSSAAAAGAEASKGAEEDEPSASPDSVSSDDAAACGSAGAAGGELMPVFPLRHLLAHLTYALAEYIFNASVSHSAQHFQLASLPMAAFPMRIRIPWSSSVSLNHWQSRWLPRSIYSNLDMIRNRCWWHGFVSWWNNKLFANDDLMHTHYAFDTPQQPELRDITAQFKAELREAEAQHLDISAKNKLIPVPLDRICRCIEW